MNNQPLQLEHKVLVGTHHKTGSAWMEGLFRRLCGALKLSFYAGEQDKLPDPFDVFFQNHSRFDLAALKVPFRGMHLTRDPRDTIISGCFYHQTAGEEWLHVPRDQFEGLSYQQKINSLGSLEEKILFEMEHSGRHRIGEMLAWNRHHPDFIEVKYEELIEDRDLVLFREIFTFLGFPDTALPAILDIAHANSLFSEKKKRTAHIRSGKSGQWEEHFTPAHNARFEELFGDALTRLGY